MSEKAYMGELVEYIKRNLKKGYTKDYLRVALTNQGYPRWEVDKAFKKAEDELALQAPTLKSKPEIKYEVVEPKAQNQEKKRSLFKRIFSLYFD